MKSVHVAHANEADNLVVDGLGHPVDVRQELAPAEAAVELDQPAQRVDRQAQDDLSHRPRVAPRLVRDRDPERAVPNTKSVLALSRPQPTARRPAARRPLLGRPSNPASERALSPPLPRRD